MQRRKFLSYSFAASSIPVLSSWSLASETAKATELPASETLDSSQLLHNLRYEGKAVQTSRLLSTGDFGRDATAIKDHALAVLNSGRYTKLRVRSGGHSYIGASISTSAYVMNLAPFNRIELDEKQNQVRVGAGCKFHQLSNFLAGVADDIYLPTGDCPTVGVSGYSLGGGISLLSPMLGFGVDRVAEATIIVFAHDGQAFTARTLRISPAENPELFWAAMGGGAQLGIVTDLTLRYERLADCSLYQVHLQNQIPEYFRDNFLAWEQLCAHQLSSSTSSKIQLDHNQNLSIVGILRNDNDDLTKLRDFTYPRGGWVETKPLSIHQLYESLAGCNQLSDCAFTAWTARADYVSAKSTILARRETLTARQLEAIAGKLYEGLNCDYAYVQFVRWAGRMTQSNKQVSFPFRDVAYECQISAKADSRERWQATGGYDSWVNTVTDLLGPRNAAYFNHLNSDVETKPELYFGEAWPLLQEVKNIYDPRGIFQAFRSANRS